MQNKQKYHLLYCIIYDKILSGLKTKGDIKGHYRMKVHAGAKKT